MNVAIVGCGAVAELFYGRALSALTASGQLTVRVLVDPSAARRATLARFFPAATPFERLEDVPAGAMDLAVVATPPRFHAAQVVWLLERGCHVLCEKPLATTLAEAEGMLAAAERTGRTLAVGLVRRFFPALQMIGEFCANRLFGRLQSFTIQEGGPFNWPAATPSFFDPKQAGGGVLLDSGVHVLDVLIWWFGEPSELTYADDAQGGLEATCRLQLGYGGESIRGSVLLSRDWKVTNQWRLEFDRATVVWRAGEANRLEVRPRGSSRWLVSTLETETPAGRTAADRYEQAFTRQILDVVESAQQGRAPRMSGAEGLRSLRLIDRCYRSRTPLTTDLS